MEKKVRKINRISFMMIVISFIIILMLPSYSADDKTDDIPSMMCEDINNGVTDVIKDNLTSDSELFVAMTEGIDSNDIITTFMNWEFALCGIIVAIICIYRMFEALNKGMDTLQCIEKMLIDICLSFILVSYIPEVLGFVVEIGSDFIGQLTLGDAEGFEGITCKDICGTNNPGILKMIKCVAILFLPWAASLIMTVAAKFISYSMLLEIGIRRAFAPIACVDMIGEGLRSPGVRYLKRYFGVFIKICICLVICILVQQCEEVILSDENKLNTLGKIFDYIFTIIAINFTAIGMMFKAGEYSNDVLGV